MDDEPEFTTANALRDEQSEPSGDEPQFAITHPERSHSRAGGMSYEGGTVFTFAPRRPGELTEQVLDLLESGPYSYGDWFDLPMPLFLVHDDDSDDTFRLGVRDDHVELHVRSATSPAGVAAFHDRLTDRVGGVELRREQ